ncbi:antibiotic biosynthesis monooxygenase [Novosphingobium sp. FGD1]|uniref:Antibiotic biosynthesis monooxygenase n=1 Tax=Novosphingobium silvae TaxID=2692619 RepID=A0A7X4K5M3_9SPHN|nr:putative quinol monooxygenase [Novosphingobium silvae]MYL97101.1 antibiotic biosynthesis monooxygenase [Novosphingobium silvae]
MRIIVAGSLRFDGDQKTCEEIILSGRELILAGRAEEGCIAYDWSIDPLDPGLMHVYEEWESERALLQHFADPPYFAMREHLGRYELTGFGVQVYSAAGVEPVYDETGWPRKEIFGITL